MIYLCMESIGNYSIVFVDRKSMPPRMFYLYLFRFELWYLYKSLLPSAKGTSLTLCNFYFDSPSSLTKATTKKQYDRTSVLGVANIWVCFMNGSMFEHDGLGITCFSIDILKDIVACDMLEYLNYYVKTRLLLWIT